MTTEQIDTDSIVRNYAHTWHNPHIPISSAIELNAGLDYWGNGRRVFVAFGGADGRVCGVHDLTVDPNLPAWFPRHIRYVTIDCKPAEVVKWRGRIERERGRFGIVAGDDPVPYRRAFTRERANRIRRREFTWRDDFHVIEVPTRHADERG